LIAYFIGNIAAKNIKIRSHVKVCQRWNVLETPCTASTGMYLLKFRVRRFAVYKAISWHTSMLP